MSKVYEASIAHHAKGPTWGTVFTVLLQHVNFRAGIRGIEVDTDSVSLLGVAELDRGWHCEWQVIFFYKRLLGRNYKSYRTEQLNVRLVATKIELCQKISYLQLLNGRRNDPVIIYGDELKTVA